MDSIQEADIGLAVGWHVCLILSIVTSVTGIHVMIGVVRSHSFTISQHPTISELKSYPSSLQSLSLSL